MAEDAVWIEECTQIYQRLIDNALYGYLKIGTRPTTIASESSSLIDVFTDGEPNSDMKASVLGRSSYIDDIPIPTKSWKPLYHEVKRFWIYVIAEIYRSVWKSVSGDGVK